MRWELLGDVLRAEWTKLRTAPGTGWLLIAVVVLTVAVSAAAAATATCPPEGCVADPAKLSLTGIELAQALWRSSPCRRSAASTAPA